MHYTRSFISNFGPKAEIPMVESRNVEIRLGNASSYVESLVIYIVCDVCLA